MPEPYSYQWTTDFATPAALSGLAVTPDLDAIALVASCTASADTYHYEYLWEAQVGDGPWAEVGRTALPTFTHYFANLNLPVRMRVSDSNGALYGDPVEAVGTLTFARWTMAHRTGNADFIHQLRYVQVGVGTTLPLDQVLLQPLSGPDPTVQQLPIVFTGQYQGERLTLQVKLTPTDAGMRDVFAAAALEAQGDIALKAPDGHVYVVALGSLQTSDLGQGGHQVVSLTATRVA